MKDKKNNAMEKVENIINSKNNRTVETLYEQKENELKNQKEKERIKEENKTEKERNKAEKLKEKMRFDEKNDGKKDKTGWLAAVIALGISTMVLACVLTFNFILPSKNDTAIEMLYRKSFYDTVEQVDNMDLNMSKFLATSDKNAMQLYLVDLAVNSELCENDIQGLPLEDENKFYTTKLVNQIGDFSKYLNRKLINGENLTDEDMATFIALYNSNITLKNTLQNTINEMGNDFTFASLKDAGSGNVLLSNLGELENLSVEYPELIYDGPFSDGKENREIKGLSGDIIEENDAISKFTGTFGGLGLKNVESLGKSEGGIVCYNVQAEVDGDVLYAQISETGGKIIMFAYSGSCGEVNFEEDKAVESASSFLSGEGLTGLKPVWINLSNNVYTINYASSKKDVIIYSDLIKVRVCAESNVVIGLEATSYYTNHYEREIGNATISVEEAREKLSKNITVESYRLAVIPIGEKAEKLSYEFYGVYDGDVYYVYIDANTGNQLEMFKVIESTEGTLLM